MCDALRLARISAALSILLLSSAVQAQWVFVARKAVGKVRTMTQHESTGAPGYSVAEVVVAGKAERVYATALETIQANPDARVTHQDPKSWDVEFAIRGQVIGLRVSQVDSKTAHLLLATTASPGQPDPTAAVVQATMRVCGEMKVTCERVK